MMQSKKCCQNCRAAVTNWERWTLMIAQLKTCVVIWLHRDRWKLLSGMRWKYQRIRLTFVLPAMICCCCILVLGILRLARPFWSCSTFFDYLNSVLPPLVERTSEDLDGILDVFVKCVVTQSRGPSNPSFGTGNSHFGPLVFQKRFVLCTVINQF